MLKSKEDSLSVLSTRLSAIRVLATMYEKLNWFKILIEVTDFALHELFE